VKELNELPATQNSKQGHGIVLRSLLNAFIICAVIVKLMGAVAACMGWFGFFIVTVLFFAKLAGWL
jgi:hypothetical protein